MPTSTHTPLGSVVAIQWTGSNAAEIRAALGAGWAVYGSADTTIISACQIGNERIALNGNLMELNDWIVSQPAYGTNAPTLANGFTVMSGVTFAQQFSA